MYNFYVNGNEVRCDADVPLLAFLRDELKLKSVKDGCSEGACGSCTIIADGRAVTSCTLTTAQADGCRILTVEGLSELEKRVFTYAFGEAGAVQCGYCTPGMVMSAKALLDSEPDPSEAAVREAIRRNICRCTGYAAIVDGILLAARLLRTGGRLPEYAPDGRLGSVMHRVDAAEKTLGTGKYSGDLDLPGMLYGACARPPAARMRVISIDKTAALAHPDCVAVLTAGDVPGRKKIGHVKRDWDVFIAEGDVTRYVGDAVALVVSRRELTLDEIRSLVDIKYEELIPVTCPEEAVADGAPELHEGGNILHSVHLSRGDADSAIASSAFVVTREYETPFTEHAFMEPECAVAEPWEDGIRLYSGSHNIYDDRREVFECLGLAPEQVRVTGMLVGGGFGGKEDMSVQHHAALAAYLLKTPVRVRLSRRESMNVHPKRHAMKMKFTTACDKNGFLTAIRAELVADTGAYASLGGPVVERACSLAGGPYKYDAVDIRGLAVYTNNPPAGAFRGFGVTQTAFAGEMNLNLLAEMAGISPWEIRYRNAVRPGDTLPSGNTADRTTAIHKCLEAVRDICGKARQAAGIACAMKNCGMGSGVRDASSCTLAVTDGKVRVRTGAACVGQGMATVITQVICETLGIAPWLVIIEQPDTLNTPNAGSSTGSRQTVFTGEAVRRAALMLLEAVSDKLAAQTTTDGAAVSANLVKLEGREFAAEFAAERDPDVGRDGRTASHVAYGYAAQVALLDKDGRLERVVAAYDLGTVINPRAAKGQIEGGVVMGMGFALTEDFPLKDCRPTAKFGTLGLTRALDAPEIDVIMVRGESGDQAFGAKGVGELAAIPGAAAIAGAYYARDRRFRNKLPLEGTYYSK